MARSKKNRSKKPSSKPLGHQVPIPKSSSSVFGPASPKPVPPTSEPAEIPTLDDNALSIYDLFKLHKEASKLLYPFPHSFTIEITPDKVDEAKGLLKRILEGCAALEPFVQDAQLVEEEDWAYAEEEMARRMESLGKERVSALGLNELVCEGWVVCLQIFALHHLFHLPEEKQPDSAAATSGTASLSSPSSNSSRPPKRRKFEQGQLETPMEYLNRAYDRAKYLTDVVFQAYADTIDHHSNTTRSDAFMQAEFARAFVSYAHNLLKHDGEDEVKPEATTAAKDLVKEKLGWDQLDWVSGDRWGIASDIGGGLEQAAEGVIGADDSVMAQLRLWEAWVALLEAHPEAHRDAAKELERVAAGLRALKEEWLTEECPGETDERLIKLGNKEKVPLWRFLIDVVAADALSARFFLLHDALEENYRSEISKASVREEDEGEGEEKGEKSTGGGLIEGKEVAVAKDAGDEAIAAIRLIITAHDKLPNEMRHDEGKKQQNRKLEDLLCASTLYADSADKDAPARAAKELAELMKARGA